MLIVLIDINCDHLIEMPGGFLLNKLFRKDTFCLLVCISGSNSLKLRLVPCFVLREYT